MKTKENLQRQFIGYQKTRQLWLGNLFGLSQFTISETEDIDFNVSIEKRLRLGHIVEHFVACEFENQKDIHVLGRNIQVYSNKKTIGEFDFLVEQNNIQYHIEVVFKFYLYDEAHGNSNVEHWIGPNRNDSLVQKIEKIKEKQFPLIDREEAADTLKSIGVNSIDVEQRVHFKAKLFVPYRKKVELDRLNSLCIAGFYIAFDDLDLFQKSQFFIPSKHDWLDSPSGELNWIDYDEARDKIAGMIDEKRSPMVWFKTQDEFLTGFVVWWPDVAN